MKRNTYSIISSRFRVSKAHAWNSALREMAIVLKTELNNTMGLGNTATCVNKELWKDGRIHTKGVFTWETNKGNIITVTIEKE